jgi:hypothetical protein
MIIKKDLSKIGFNKSMQSIPGKDYFSFLSSFYVFAMESEFSFLPSASLFYISLNL